MACNLNRHNAYRVSGSHSCLRFTRTWRRSTGRRNVSQRRSAHEDEEQREAARSAVRGFIDQIVIPPGDALLEVRGDLGRMVTAAAGERDASMLAAVVECGCGARNPLNLEFSWAAA